MKRVFKAYWKLTAKLVLGLVVCVAVGLRLQQAWLDLRLKGELPILKPAVLGASSLIYLTGLVVFGIVFWAIMGQSDTPLALGPALRGYLIGHLGKYVPGKALVVVMRVALVGPYGARKSTAAFATFYETLVMMAAGSVLALVGFAVGGGRRYDLGIAAILAAAFLVVVQPRVFCLLSRWVALPFPSVDSTALPRLSHRLLGIGLAWSVLGWLLLGASQIVLLLMFTNVDNRISATTWLSVTAGVAFATVAGFVVPISPGGLGVRELILAEAIAPALGSRDRAIVSAVLLRLVWIVAEAVAASLLIWYRPRIRATAQP